MDFSSPSGGRIISDPREAAAVSRSPSSRPPPLLRAHLGASTSSLVPPHTPGPELSAAWFRPQLGREQANLALFPHRQTTGLFLVRASSRSQQSFVLSFTTQVDICQLFRTNKTGLFSRGRSFTPRSWQCLAGTPHRQLSRWTVVEPSLPASRNLSSSTR